MGDHDIHQGRILLLTGCLPMLAFKVDNFFEISQRKQN
jgi:hypothetical protein